MGFTASQHWKDFRFREEHGFTHAEKSAPKERTLLESQTKRAAPSRRQRPYLPSLLLRLTPEFYNKYCII
jgi:hypothetical protein